MNIAQTLFSTSPSQSASSNVFSGALTATEGTIRFNDGSFYRLFSSMTTEKFEDTSSLIAQLESFLSQLEVISVAGSEDELGQDIQLGKNTELEVLELDHQALTGYLVQLLEQLEEYEQQKTSTLDPELLKAELVQLYQQFLLIPVQSLNTEAVSTYGTTPTSFEAGPALAKWEALFQLLFAQGSDTRSLNSTDTPILQQVQRAASLLNQNMDWKGYLTEKLAQEAAIVVDKPSNEGADKSFKGPSFLPMSLLKGTNDGQTLPLLQAQQEGSQVAAKQAPASNLPADHQILSFLQSAKGDESTAPVKSMEGTGQTVRFSHLLEDIQNVIQQQLKLKTTGEGTQIRLKLTPEHLGQLDIRLTAIDGKIHAQLLTSSQMAKDALDVSIGQLRVALQQQGIQIDRIEITQQQTMHQSLQDHREGQAFAQHQQQSSGSKKSAATYEEDEILVDDAVTDGEEQAIDFKA